MLWFTIFFLVILKIPAVYLGYVIWWAVKDPPDSGADAIPVRVPLGEDGGGSARRFRAPRPIPGRRPGPHGSPSRRPGPAFAPGRAERRR